MSRQGGRGLARIYCCRHIDGCIDGDLSTCCLMHWLHRALLCRFAAETVQRCNRVLVGGDGWMDGYWSWCVIKVMSR